MMTPDAAATDVRFNNLDNKRNPFIVAFLFKQTNSLFLELPFYNE